MSPASSGPASSDDAAAAAASVPACPSYLRPLAGDILTAGKSLRLLKSGDHTSVASSANTVTGRPDIVPTGGRPSTLPPAPTPWVSEVNGWRIGGDGGGICEAFLGSAVDFAIDYRASKVISPRSRGSSRRPEEATQSMGGTQMLGGSRPYFPPDLAPPSGGMQDPGAMSSEPTPASYFSLMASAGRGLCRPEPWQEASRGVPFHPLGAAGNLDRTLQPPAMPWLPPWVPSDEPSTTVIQRRSLGAERTSCLQGPGRSSEQPPLEGEGDPSLCLSPMAASTADIDHRPSTSPVSHLDSDAALAPSTAPNSPFNESGGLDHDHPEAQEEAEITAERSATRSEGHWDRWRRSVAEGMKVWGGHLAAEAAAGGTASVGNDGMIRGLFEEIRSAIQPNLKLPRPGSKEGSGFCASLMWRHGLQRLPEQQCALDRLAWLLDGDSDAAELPPIDVLLEHCLTPLIRDRVGMD